MGNQVRLGSDFQRQGLAYQQNPGLWVQGKGVTNTGALTLTGERFAWLNSIPQISDTVSVIRPRGGAVGQLRFAMIDAAATVNGRTFSWQLWALAEQAVMEEAQTPGFDYAGHLLANGTGTIGSLTAPVAQSLIKGVDAAERIGLCDTLAITNDYSSIPGMQILNGGVVGAFWSTLQFTQMPVCRYLLEMQSGAGRMLAQWSEG